MSVAVETLYSVDYGYPSQYDVIQGPEFWGAYGLSRPSYSAGVYQSPMVVTQYNAASAYIVPYTSGSTVGVFPMPMYDTHSYHNGQSYGELVSNLSNGNFPYISGYYWDSGRSEFRNYNYSRPSHYSFEFWNPNTSSYHEVDISWKLRDEHDVIAHWDANTSAGMPSETHTYQGYQLYPEAQALSSLPVKTNDLYFTFLDGSLPNRYICDAYLDFIHNDNTGYWHFYAEGYYDRFNPYTSIIAKLNGYSPSWSGYSELWHYYADNADAAARAYPIITNIHRNFDDPNKNWVGELSIGVQNKPLWILGTDSDIRQIKGASTSDLIDPRDVDGEGIFIPESYGPFGNWLVRLQPTGLMYIAASSVPIQQRIFTISKRTGLTFTDYPPGPTIPNT